MKTRTPKLAGGALLASALALIAAPLALAQQETVNDYVRRMIDGFSGPGETLVDAIRLEELEIDDSTEFVFDIDPDKTYFVYSACDDDCYDIDLYAHDADEELVDVDDEDDATPVMMILPGESGDEVHIVIELVECDTETCLVGVGLYEAEE
jgi:hypothetical protein